MAENKKSFLLYTDLIHTVKKLPKEKIGELFLLILEYVNDLNPDIDSQDILIQIAFEPIKLQLKRDLKHWEKIKKIRSESGKKGGRPKKQIKAKKANGFFEKQTKAKKAVTVNVNVNDINKKKINYKFIQEKFNELCPELQSVKKITPEREKHIKARINDFSEDEIIEVFKIVSKSDFLCGKNKNNWKATFDWILNPNNFIKISERHYDNKKRMMI